MKTGTKSLLFGIHQFMLHPFVVAYAWWTLYGFPWNPILWCAFTVHDWGYWGKKRMDDEEGEKHVELGAWIMHKLFDWPRIIRVPNQISGYSRQYNYRWLHFTLFHSRFYAKKAGLSYSKLCVADKAAIYALPKPIYLFLGRLSGEVWEYFGNAIKRNPQASTENFTVSEWYDAMTDYVRGWVHEHKDCREDTWTKVDGHGTLHQR